MDPGLCCSDATSCTPYFYGYPEYRQYFGIWYLSLLLACLKPLDVPDGMAECVFKKNIWQSCYPSEYHICQCRNTGLPGFELSIRLPFWEIEGFEPLVFEPWSSQTNDLKIDSCHLIARCSELLG